MRAAVLGGVLALVVVSPAFAAQGYKGKVTTSLTLSVAFLKAADPYGNHGLDLDSFTIPPVTGMIYIAGDQMRLDMAVPGTTLTSLFDGAGNSYVLDHGKKVARLLPRVQGSADLPLFNLEQFATDWDQMDSRLTAVPGMRVSQLGRKTVNGQRCRGIRCRGDIRKLLAADEFQIVPGLPNLANPKGEWQGTFWVSERLGMPVKITTSFSGINLVWQVSEITPGDIPETLFKLPPGYRVKTVELRELTLPQDV